MKKYLCMALIILSCVSCQEKNDDISENAVEETVTEISVRELTERDFSVINLNLRYSQAECPIEVREESFSGLDFGQKMSPCKAENVREQYQQIHYDDPELQKELLEQYDKICETPSSGEIMSYTSNNDSAFFEVNFDDYCHRHCSSLFAYDYDTGKVRELSSKEGLEETNYNYGSLYCVDDMLIYFDYETLNNHENQTTDTIMHIIQVDTKTGKESEVLSGDYDYVYHIDKERIMLGTFLTNGDEIRDISETGVKITEYDLSTGQTQIISESDSFTNDMKIFFDDGSTGRIIQDDKNDTVNFITDEVNMLANHKKVVYNALWKDKAVVITNEALAYTSNYMMYTYDFNKMECLVSKLDGFGRNFVQVGNGLVSTSYGGWEGNKSPVNYIIPKSGNVFRLAETNSGNVDNISDNFCFMERPVYTYDQYGRRIDENNDFKVYHFELK